MNELRRDYSNQAHSNNNNGGNSNNSNINHDYDHQQQQQQQQQQQDNDDDRQYHEEDYNNGVRPSAPPTPSAPIPSSASASGTDNYVPNRNQYHHHGDDDIDIDDIDDSIPTLSQRIKNTWLQFKTWYFDETNNDDVWKTILHLSIGILILYVAFGGRFGLDSSLGRISRSNQRTSSCGSSSSSSDDNYRRMGNYGEGNAYDQFYNRDRYDGYRRTSSSSNRYNDNYNHQQNRHESTNDRYDPYDRYDSHGSSSNYNSGRTGSYGENISSSRRTRTHRSNDWESMFAYIIAGIIMIGLNKILGLPIHAMPMGFGMRRAFFGGFGPGFGAGGVRMRYGGGGFGFPRFHMRGFGAGGPGGRFRYQRRP